MSNRKTAEYDEVESYLQTGLPSYQVANLMKLSGKDEGEIGALVERYEESRNKIKKYIRKFIDKIERKYGELDVPELIKKGMKFARKHGFSKAEEKEFVDQVMKGDDIYQPYPEMPYSDMSKFLGFSSVPSFMNIKPTDHAILDEISQLFDGSKGIHGAIKQNLALYKSCSPEAITGRYDRDKHNIAVFIHPVIVALFLPRINAIQKRMLISNVGRMVVQRSFHLLKKYQAYSSQIIGPEIQADLELMTDIARDPNSMNYFSDDTPLSNLLKRFKIQIEVYKNVLSLRSGNYYSKNESDMGDDYVSGLNKILQSYEWTYFDSPEYYHIQDEGTFLRKLLSVFSLRPTFTQLSSLMTSSAMGYSNFGTSRLTYVNTPIVNVRLPRISVAGNQAVPFIRLSSALSQTEYFIENKMIIPKHKVVIHTRDLLFFYVNRRYHEIKFQNTNFNLNYMTLPGTISNLTNVNQTELHFDEKFQIGSDREPFFLRSVVVLNFIPYLDSKITTIGCSTIVINNQSPGQNLVRANPVYFYYNPVTANLMFVGNNKQYTTNKPVMTIPEYKTATGPGFYDLARKFGTIFVYSGKEDS
jgi:hypothetical protein